MNEVLQRVYQIGIIPVIAIDDADKAVPLAQALVKGGLPAAEVTFRTAAGEEAIRRIAAEVPDMLVGAGTVLTTEQADRAIAAGALVADARDVAGLREDVHGVVNPAQVEGARACRLRVPDARPGQAVIGGKGEVLAV